MNLKISFTFYPECRNPSVGSRCFDLFHPNKVYLMYATLVVQLIMSWEVFLIPALMLLALIPFLPYVHADHGQEIALTLHNSSFGSLTSGAGNQVSIFANYELNDRSLAGQPINAVMDVYAPNGTLIKTSSYPDGFIAQGTGGIEGLETTISDPLVQSVAANVTFRNLDKTQMLSNSLSVNLNLSEEGAPTPGEEVGVEEDTLFENAQDPTSAQQPGQDGIVDSEEDDDGSQNVEPTIPSVPIG